MGGKIVARMEPSAFEFAAGDGNDVILSSAAAFEAASLSCHDQRPVTGEFGQSPVGSVQLFPPSTRQENQLSVTGTNSKQIVL
jgi:hypothetical protein